MQESLEGFCSAALAPGAAPAAGLADRQATEEASCALVAMTHQSIKPVWTVERSTRSVCLVVRGSKVCIVPLAAAAAGLPGGDRTQLP